MVGGLQSEEKNQSRPQKSDEIQEIEEGEKT